MSLEDLGNIGEFVAAVGVIISLIYLAVQIRQNTASVRTSTHQQIVSVFSSLNAIVGSNRETGWLYMRGLQDPDELTEEEAAQFTWLFLSAIRIYENIFYQRRAGALDDPVWLSWVQSMKVILGSPGGRAWWEPRRFLFHDEFCRFVEADIQSEDAISLVSKIASRTSRDNNAH
jgi:hypothetical protein